MSYLFQVFIFIWLSLDVSGAKYKIYNRYSDKAIEDNELRQKYHNRNCTIEIEPCAPHEGSRIDGTCNNFKYPSKGSARGPYLRMLTPDYGNNNQDIRMNRKGAPLPTARKVRTALQSTGRVDDKHTFNVAAVHFLEFIGKDVSVLNGPLDYIRNRQHCCQPEGKADRRCAPIRVPEDDPYLKVTDIRCLNFSRAETFQDAGCAPETIYPEQINFQTPSLDLSTIYGVDEMSSKQVRAYKHGLLNLESRRERYVPLNIINNTTKLTDNETETLPPEMSEVVRKAVPTRNDVCIQNQCNETYCYLFGLPEVGNFDIRTTTLTIFFMREHNRLAKILHELNPCWKDDRLFKVARQINIATAANIFFYELLPVLLGYENMMHNSLISERVQHLNVYKNETGPLVYTEYDIATRFFHTLLDGRVKKYNENYYYTGYFSFSDTIYRSGVIEQEANFEEINRGTFYQKAAKVDDVVDPEISENFYGGLQRTHDLVAIDIQRGRDLGVRGYNDYRHLCGMKPAKKFEDFLDVMDMEKVLALKKLYDDIEDVDLLAGIASETLIQNAFVGPTLFCIMTKQLQLFRFSDRFWFERGDQFHSFTIPQLYEIRRTNIARLACNNAEAIKFIQPRAFLNVGHGNAHVPCTHIPGLDLTKWQDPSCYTRTEQRSYKRPKTNSYKQKGNVENVDRLQPKNVITDHSPLYDDIVAVL
ncbi:peroxidase-like [Hyposmocoma kahamanoa]|uniref:peroxidase-like n=1 Tax=Hyposmocoma kahamanoa TaxID=1477025 RepID=UPI000E6D8E16|nr:peroxidase-like [Hyposmocoma kahamanoa]